MSLVETAAAPRRLLGGLCAAAILATAAPLAPLPTPPRAEAQEAVTLDHGHVDAFNVSAPSGALTLDLKEDVTGSHVHHAPEDVTLAVKDQARTEDTAGIDGIGKSGFLLPQTQDEGLLWPGWDSQEVREAGFTEVDINFREVTGPGEVFLFQNKGFGDLAAVTTSANMQLGSGDTIHQSEPGHVHANWLFTEPGTYRMRVSASSGGQESNEATYTWQVGGEAAQADDAAGTSTYAANSTGSERDDAAQVSGQAGGGQTSQGKTSATQSSEAKKAAAQSKDNPQPAGSVSSSASAGGASGTTGAQCTPGLVPRIKDDRSVPATWQDPAKLTFGLGDAAKAQLPQAIGPVPAGDVWMIGSTQQSGVPWLGANTQHPSLLENTTGAVTWEVTGFEGPGPMTVFTQGGLGKIVGEEWFRASGGSAQGSHTIPANSHVHPSWVFGKQGTYHVTVKQTTKTKDGKAISGSARLTFVVGGQGNANDGHFDFGAVFDPKGDCGAAGAGGSGASSGALANTGLTTMTLPFAVMGLGVAVFGAGMVRLTRKLERR